MKKPIFSNSLFSVFSLVIILCLSFNSLSAQRSKLEQGRKGKLDVCHKGKIINVSENAIPAHIKHGDAVDMDGDGYWSKASPCSKKIDADDNDASVTSGCDGIAFTDYNGNNYVLRVMDGLHTQSGAQSLCRALAEREGCEWYLPSSTDLRHICKRSSPRVVNTEAWSSTLITDEIGRARNIEFNDSECDNKPGNVEWELKCICVRKTN